MDFKKMKKEEIVKEYNTLKKRFDSLNADMEGTLKTLQAKEAEIKSKNEEIASRDEEIKRLTSQVNQCKDEINETVCNLQEARKQVVSLSEEHKSLHAYLDSLKDKNVAFNIWKYSAIVLGLALLVSICIMFA